ncbi:SspB-related isopeptide-forming adhesin [Lactobacillus sp. AN1001]
MIKALNKPEVKTRYKLYKRKKQWVVSGISTVAATSLMFAFQTGIAHADTANTNNSIGDTPDKSSTGNNAVNQTTALSQSVTVDHSQLDKAVNDAKNAGLSVDQQPTTNQTVTEDKSDQAEAEIKNSYDQQTEQINKNIQEYLHDKNNYETYNNSEADHSNLDNAVNEAKKVPGLNVVQDETKVETAQASDDTTIKNWKDKTTKDYEEQTKTVEEATAKQQAAYSEWLKNKQEQESQYNPSKAIRTESAFVPAVVSYNNSTDVSSSLSGAGHQVGNEYGTWYDMYNDGKQTVKYTGLDYNSVVTARWKNAAVDPKTGQSLDFVINMTNFIKPTVPIGDMYVGVFKDLNSGICWDGTTAFKLTSGLYKSGTNELYDGYYISSQDSLDRQLPVDGQGGRAEFVSPKSGVIASFLPSDSKVMVDEQPVHGTAANMTPTAFYSSGIHSYADGPQAMIFLSKGLSSYVIGTTNPNGNDATNVNWGKEVIGAYFVQLGFGANSMKTVPMPTNEVHYSYNKLNIPFTSIIRGEAKYQYHNLNVLSEPHKDVGSGEVSGTIKQSTDGKVVPKGSEITFSLTMPDMPAYRTDNISSRTTVDHLDPKFGYQKLKVWVQDSNGKLEDMTSHVKAELHGYDLYITEDDVLLARYNQDKSKKISVPVINLYGTALQDASKIYNTYEVYTNDAKAVSNTVTVPTPDAPKPVKKDLNDQGVDINGKSLLSGEKPVFEIVADYDQYKGITANQVDIDKGFAIIDDYPDEAMVLEPGNATAFDVQNKPVTDLEYKIYNSLKEAPSNVQLAVARSGLAIKGAFLVASPKDNKEYFTKYVQTGNSVTVRLPGTIKKGYSGSLVNGGYEIDFGNGYATNVVTNPVSKIDPKKDVVLNVKDNASINKHIIKIGQKYNYELLSSVRPANYGGNTKSWSISDTFDKRDHYNNQTLVQAKKDFVIDGHIVKTGEDITKYFNIKFDAATNKLTVTAKPEYVTALNSDINKAREQQFVAYANVTRVGAGHVTNEFGETYNGVPVESNEVYTNTLNDPVKDWETDKNEVSTDKNFLVGEHAVGNVTADIPTKDMFTDGYKFEKYDIYDNYSDFAKKATVGNSKVLVGEGEKAVDVTDLFNIVNDSSKSVVTAQAKNPTDLLKYGGQKLHLLTDFKINNNAGEASKLTNDGGALVNDVEMKISKRPTITTFTNTPVKDVNLSEVNDPANKDQVVSINGRTVIDKTVVTFPLATKEALPAN